ncbi:hypothetical protein COB57_05215 [Candidatus Peregrinibacteria bacterium]|nr:MAG: hypothetical protein COB57_05215 [Candidatus Peregrinibacteria bacterium]
MKYLALFSLFVAPMASADFTLLPSKGDLAEKVQHGSLELSDLLVFLNYILEKFLWLVGLIAILFVVIKGYKYIFGVGGEGKGGIMNIVIGLALVIFSWLIVDVFIRFVTGG